MARKVRVLPLVAVGIVVVLIGAAAVWLIPQIAAGGPQGQKVAMLTGMREKMREAGQVTIKVHADHRTDLETERIAWFGTTQVRWEPFLTSTTYSKIQMDAAPNMELEWITDGTDQYYKSPAFVTEDKKPWIRYPQSGVSFPAVFADPVLGLPDLPFWLDFIGDIGEEAALNAITDELEDMPEAPHEFVVNCNPSYGPACPPPFPAPLDQFVNSSSAASWMFWFNDDGLPIRIQTRVRMGYDRNQPLSGTGSQGAPYVGTYVLINRWDLSDYGNSTPIAVPPADQVTTDRAARLARN